MDTVFNITRGHEVVVMKDQCWLEANDGHSF